MTASKRSRAWDALWNFDGKVLVVWHTPRKDFKLLGKSRDRMNTGKVGLVEIWTSVRSNCPWFIFARYFTWIDSAYFHPEPHNGWASSAKSIGHGTKLNAHNSTQTLKWHIWRRLSDRKKIEMKLYRVSNPSLLTFITIGSFCDRSAVIVITVVTPNCREKIWWTFYISLRITSVQKRKSCTCGVKKTKNNLMLCNDPAITSSLYSCFCF